MWSRITQDLDLRLSSEQSGPRPTPPAPKPASREAWAPREGNRKRRSSVARCVSLGGTKSLFDGNEPFGRKDRGAIRLAKLRRQTGRICRTVPFSAALIFIAGVSGSGPLQITRVATANTTPPGTASTEQERRKSARQAKPGTGAATRPGMVLIDHDARRTELESGGNKLCRVWEGDYATTTIPPMVKVMALPEDGIDERFAPARDAMMQLGAACLKFKGAPCQTIVDTMLAWAKVDAAVVRSSGDTDQLWNDSKSVNLWVVRPFLDAYAFARASVPVSPDEDAAIRRWVEKVLGRSKHLMRGLRRKGRNYAAHNHAVASASALMAYGAMWGEERAFKHGIEQWTITLRDMRRDGSLPIEARRGAQAMAYTGRTLSGLMSLAEMARVQGIDLYGSAPSAKKSIQPGGRLHGRCARPQ